MLVLGFAYTDAPQKMGQGWSLSAPHLHANALQVSPGTLNRVGPTRTPLHSCGALRQDKLVGAGAGAPRQVLAPKLIPGARCLDVGCGSGLVSVTMAWLVAGPGTPYAASSSGMDAGVGGSELGRCASRGSRGAGVEPGLRPGGFCVGVDIVPEAVHTAKRIARENFPKLALAGPGGVAPGSTASLGGSATDVGRDPGCELGGVRFAEGNGWALPGEAEGPFDVIHVGAAVSARPLLGNSRLQLFVSPAPRWHVR